MPAALSSEPDPFSPPSGTPARPLALVRPRENLRQLVLRQGITGLIVFGPVLALLYVLRQSLDGTLPTVPILLLAVACYFIVGHGVTVGFHRLFTHRAFHACRPLKIGLALTGSMALQGSIIGWVAEHRRHHQFTDVAGDPHSPRRTTAHFGRSRGFVHAHVGWFFARQDTSKEQYAPDLLADRDIVLIDRLFVPLSIATLAVPFLLGFAITGSLAGAIAALLWAGVLRVALLHHVTRSTNSVCHVIGTRPFRTADASRNFAPLLPR